MNYVLLALNVLKQHKGELSAASLKIREGIIEAIREKLEADIVPTDAEKARIKSLIPHLNDKELEDELLKFIER